MLSPGHFTGFKRHAKLEGTHATLSPSSPAWLRYTEEHLLERLTTLEAAARGTRLHETASRCISDGIRLRDDGDHPYLAEYVNDAIDYGMVAEQSLFYSFNIYGTADAIGFDPVNLFLRIFDLKSGKTKPDPDQLYVYAALFCLEYGYLPFEIQGELRFYKRSGTEIYDIDRGYLSNVYDTIRISDEIIEQRRTEGMA